MYYNDVLDLIGNTPLMCLRKSTGYNIFAKAEYIETIWGVGYRFKL